MTERKPHRQICSICNREYAIDFQVPDEIWDLAVHVKQRNDLICLDCFTRMADIRFVEWERGLEIYPTSLITHIRNLHHSILPEHSGTERPNEREKSRIAKEIFNEEQRYLRALRVDPTNPHFNGAITGLQRARDIANSVTTGTSKD